MELVQALMAIVQALVDVVVVLAYLMWAVIGLGIVAFVAIVISLVRRKFTGCRFARRV
jgi:hypothetical protein